MKQEKKQLTSLKYGMFLIMNLTYKLLKEIAMN